MEFNNYNFNNHFNIKVNNLIVMATTMKMIMGILVLKDDENNIITRKLIIV